MTTLLGATPETVAAWMLLAVGVILLGLLVLAAFNRVLLRMALRNALRRRAQTVLILFGLMIATLMFTSSLAVGDTLMYSLLTLQAREIGGIDEWVLRRADAGAALSESAFFTGAQASTVIARATADPSVAAASGVVFAQGSVVDVTSSQAAANRVEILGVQADFSRIWGDLRSRAGPKLVVTDLEPQQVFIGTSLASRLDARAGDQVRIYLAGRPFEAVIKDVLDTEVDPTLGWPGPPSGSILMPLAAMRDVIGRPEGYNVILLRNHGSGGFDDLGPGGVTSAEINRRVGSTFIDAQAAQELKAYLSAPAVRTQLTRVRDATSIFDPFRAMTSDLLRALDLPYLSDEFKALSANGVMQQKMSEAVDASLPTAAGSDAHLAAARELGALLAALRVDSDSAAELKVLLSGAEIRTGLSTLIETQTATDPGRAIMTGLLAELDHAGASPNFRATVARGDVQAQLAALVGQVAPDRLDRFNEIVGRLNLFVFVPSKALSYREAQDFGLIGAGFLLLVSVFAMAVGALLIFLIFVMLAAERRAEMGISRAVGLKRSHLIQMFLFEGAVYTLAASGIGVVLGVVGGQLMTEILGGASRANFGGLELHYHIEWTSLAIAAGIGILLTFAAVAVSAYRVSRLNIVTAIRDLNEQEKRDVGLVRMFTGVFTTAWFGLRQLRRGHPLVFLSRITWGTMKAIGAFWWALFRRGPMTLALGLLLVFLSASNAPSAGAGGGIEVVYASGISLCIIGWGLLIRWILTLARVRGQISGRAGFTAAALGLLIYWGHPLGRFEKLLGIENTVQVSKLIDGTVAFPIASAMVLLGAIWLVTYNSELLIRGVMLLSSRIGGIAPVTRTSMAYPLANKFRTGLVLAMFAAVTFTLVQLAVYKDVLLAQAVQPPAGGWQIVAGSPTEPCTNLGAFCYPPSNVTYPTDLADRLRSDSAVGSQLRAVGWEDANLWGSFQKSRAGGGFNGPDPNDPLAVLHVVDDGYLSNTGLAVEARAAGYASDRAVWDAVRDKVGYAVIDSSMSTMGPSIKASDRSFEPFLLQFTAPDAAGFMTRSTTLTVVGLVSQLGGPHVSTRTALSSHLFAPSNAGVVPASTLSIPPLAPSGYYFMLQPSADVKKTRLELGRILAQYQLEPIVVAERTRESNASSLTLMNLLGAFLALALIVGIAGLGVITIRSVIERWQQIGMLRALGYRRSLVQRSFFIESSLVAILGLGIGTTVGICQSYRLVVANGAFGRVPFHVPVLEIAGILLLAYLATLLTTYIPARTASRIAPAAALRYE